MPTLELGPFREYSAWTERWSSLHWSWKVLSDQNIESELSYAYLHAVASRAGFACECASRHLDNASVDAVVREDGRRLDPMSDLTSFELHVQLKATAIPPSEHAGYYSHGLPLNQYNRLRAIKVNSPRILVVLYLPADRTRWLEHGDKSLVLCGCAYWVSLRGAASSANRSSQTVFLPRNQLLCVEGLTELMTRASRREEILYHEPRDPDVGPGESREDAGD